METILVGIDGSPAALEALSCAVDVAKASGAQLAFVCVTPVLYEQHGVTRIPLDEPSPQAVATDRRTAEMAAIVARAAGVSATSHSAQGDPAEMLGALADELGADLIVVGSRGLGSLRAALLGSVSLRLLETARVPVMVVKSTHARPVAAA